MTSWTALLEALHSSLVDELNGRFPEEKPELGMPLRQAIFAIPHSSVTELCFCETFLGEVRGLAFLAGDTTAQSSLEAVWVGMIKHAGAELSRRNVKPRMNPMRKMAVTAGSVAWPTGLPQPGRVIWIPFRLRNGSYTLGLGV